MELTVDTIQRFRHLYGEEPEILVTAPGRVNLLGEHTDYNKGFVFPVAIDRQIIIAAGPRRDEMLSLHSVDFQHSLRIPLDKNTFDEGELWSNYPKGVARVFRDRGYLKTGANFCIRGNIPIAVGLSSSAAMEVASAIAFRFLDGVNLSALELALLAQQSEIEFVGVQCGIMDQFVSVMGKKGHALFLDCLTMKHEYIPFPANVQLVICDTGVKRELARSSYNQRRAECDEAVRQLAVRNPSVASLRDVSPEEFKDLERALTLIPAKRARHVISENQRVLRGVRAMKNNDLDEFGRLMVESHASLKNDFEVSSRELDVFVDVATRVDGVFGARMTGGGFGGCGICIVAEDSIDELVDHLRTEYPRYAGKSLTVYLSAPEDGAAVMYPQQSLTPIPISDLA
jgi:galactokinase